MLKSRLKIRSVGSTLSRIQSIFQHYGMNDIRFSRTLCEFIRLMQNYHIVPTLPVTAVVLDRNPRLFYNFQDVGVEFAIHGYRHIDYTQLTTDEINEHLESAIEIFTKHGIQWSGYRFPFLRWNKENIELLGAGGMKWDSSQVISWDSLNPKRFSKQEWLNYTKILQTYRPVDAADTQSLPVMLDNLIEIPVSVPDDDMLIGRLGLTDQEMMVDIWYGILQSTRERGELFVLQVHPERFNCYKKALERVVRSAREGGDVWIAPLGEIARWWKEKESFDLDIKKISRHRFGIHIHASDRATVLLQNANGLRTGRRYIGKGSVIAEKYWELESPVRPVLGVAANTPLEVIQYLKEEGFIIEFSEDPNDCSYFLNFTGRLGGKEKRQILQNIEKSKFPLIRFWRWPHNSNCCLAVSGDIDNVTIWDFMERFHG